MEVVTVTKAFRDNYEFWINKKIAAGQFGDAEAAEIKAAIRQDLAKGPDKNRESLTVIQTGAVVTSAINDQAERYRLWDEFFTAAGNVQ